MEHTLEFRQVESLQAEERASEKSEISSASPHQDIWKDSETNRYGVTLLMLGLSIMIGAIAAPYAVIMGKWQFALVLIPSVFTLLMSISLAPVRVIVWSGVFTTVLGSIVIIIGELQGIS